MTDEQDRLWARRPHGRHAELYDAEYAKQLERIARIRSEVSVSAGATCRAAAEVTRRGRASSTRRPATAGPRAWPTQRPRSRPADAPRRRRAGGGDSAAARGAAATSRRRPRSATAPHQATRPHQPQTAVPNHCDRGPGRPRHAATVAPDLAGPPPRARARGRTRAAVAPPPSRDCDRSRSPRRLGPRSPAAEPGLDAPAELRRAGPAPLAAEPGRAAPPRARGAPGHRSPAARATPRPPRAADVARRRRPDRPSRRRRTCRPREPPASLAADALGTAASRRSPRCPGPPRAAGAARRRCPGPPRTADAARRTCRGAPRAADAARRRPLRPPCGVGAAHRRRPGPPRAAARRRCLGAPRRFPPPAAGCRSRSRPVHRQRAAPPGGRAARADGTVRPRHLAAPHTVADRRAALALLLGGGAAFLATRARRPRGDRLPRPRPADRAGRLGRAGVGRRPDGGRRVGARRRHRKGRPAPALRLGGTPARLALERRFAWIADTERSARDPRAARRPWRAAIGPDRARPGRRRSSPPARCGPRARPTGPCGRSVRSAAPRVLHVGVRPIALAGDEQRVVVLDAIGALYPARRDDPASGRARRSPSAARRSTSRSSDDVAWVADAERGHGARRRARHRPGRGADRRRPRRRSRSPPTPGGVYVVCRGDRTLVRLDVDGKVRSRRPTRTASHCPRPRFAARLDRRGNQRGDPR